MPFRHAGLTEQRDRGIDVADDLQVCEGVGHEVPGRRLVGQQKVEWQSRAQFYGLASTLMRHILVDYARKNQTAKRGGDLHRISLESANQIALDPQIEFLAIHEALERLAAFDLQKSRIVELRFFGGLSINEIAEVLKIGHATVERDWKLARAWLRRELE